MIVKYTHAHTMKSQRVHYTHKISCQSTQPWRLVGYCLEVWCRKCSLKPHSKSTLAAHYLSWTHVSSEWHLTIWGDLHKLLSYRYCNNWTKTFSVQRCSGVKTWRYESHIKKLKALQMPLKILSKNIPIIFIDTVNPWPVVPVVNKNVYFVLCTFSHWHSLGPLNCNMYKS